jgi:hypothetical protein
MNSPLLVQLIIGVSRRLGNVRLSIHSFVDRQGLQSAKAFSRCGSVQQDRPVLDTVTGSECMAAEGTAWQRLPSTGQGTPGFRALACFACLATLLIGALIWYVSF